MTITDILTIFDIDLKHVGSLLVEILVRRWRRFALSKHSLDSQCCRHFSACAQASSIIFFSAEKVVVVVVVVVEMNIIKVALSHFCCRTTVQSDSVSVARQVTVRRW